MRPPLIFAFLSFLAPSLAFPFGRSSAEFLNMGSGARYSAMGEAGVAVADDANALFWNPANLARARGRSFSVMYGAYVESINYQSMSYTQATGKNGTWGGIIQSLSAGSINQTDDTGQSVGDFSPRDISVGGGWGKTFLGRGSLGGTAKYIHSKIIHSAHTWAMDGGVGWRFPRVQAALAVRNLGGHLTYDREPNDLPLSYHAGASTKIGRFWLMTVQGIFPRGEDTATAVGTEYQWVVNSRSSLFFRGGYNSRTNDIPGFNRFTAGLGWSWLPFQIDYAWVPLGDLGQTHRFSLTIGL